MTIINAFNASNVHFFVGEKSAIHLARAQKLQVVEDTFKARCEEKGRENHVYFRTNNVVFWVRRMCSSNKNGCSSTQILGLEFTSDECFELEGIQQSGCVY